MDMVLREEQTARFLTQNSQFSRANARVKPGVFVPPVTRLDLSISRISGLSEEEIWPLGEPVAASHGYNLYGRAELPASAYVDLHLTVNPDEPPPRHASVQGWPPLREDQLLLAQKLAPQAKLILKE